MQSQPWSSISSRVPRAFLLGRESGCELSWPMGVEDADFYVFEIADRSGSSFTRAELEEAGWSVGLSR